jgi:hypothetical protein
MQFSCVFEKKKALQILFMGDFDPEAMNLDMAELEDMDA